MDIKQLNSEAVLAKRGSEDAMWNILIYYQRYIHRMSESNRNLIWSQADFEEDCYKRVREAVHSYEQSRGSFKAHVESKLHERLKRWKKRYYNRCRGVETVSVTNKEGADLEFEDDLAIIDDNVLTNEKVTILADGDSRKLAILNAWTYLNLNNSQTAILLAQNFGGKPESCRKEVTRFKSQCQKALAYAV